MKLNHPLRSIAVIVSLMTLVACSSTVKLDEPAKIDDRSGSLSDNAGNLGGSANRGGIDNNSGSNSALDPLSDPNSPLAQRSIYFNFDEFTVRDDYKRTLEAHAKYLINNPKRTLVIEGNADERGGREYNLALGQKRAEAVRKVLTLLGVANSQIEAVSLGEEKPRATGNDEASYAENRRADLIYR